MAFPLAAIPLLTKAGTKLAALGTAMKGMGATKAATGFGAGLPKAAAVKVGGMPGTGAATKMAGNLGAKAKAATEKANIKYLKDNYGVDVGGSVKDVLNRGLNMSDDAGILDRIKRGTSSFEGFKKNLGVPMTKEDIMMTVAPDLLFGGLAAVTTEGDLADKAIAGIGSAAGGIGGGIGLRGVLGPKAGSLGMLTTEMVGGIGGDMVGMSVADSLIRAKHGGMTPAEQRYAQQDDAYKQQIIDQFLAENGMG